MKVTDIFERVMKEFGGLNSVAINLNDLTLETEVNDKDRLRIAEIEYKIAECVKKSIDKESENVLGKYKRILVMEEITKGI